MQKARNNINILFIGWNENGEKCLTKLLKKNIHVSKVLVPKNYDTRNMFRITSTYQVSISETDGSHQEMLDYVNKYTPNLIVVASFPKLLKKEVLKYPQYGAINIHAAALPKYRGYHPINWAIIKDESEVGVSIHYIDEGVDSGDIIAQKLIQVTNKDDGNTLRKKLTSEGARLLIKVVDNISKSRTKLKGRKQIERDASFAPKRNPEDGKIHWEQNTRDIYNLVRALKHPYPNAFSYTQNDEEIAFEDCYVPAKKGIVLAKIKGFYLITTGDGVILLKSKKILKIGEVLK